MKCCHALPIENALTRTAAALESASPFVAGVSSLLRAAEVLTAAFHRRSPPECRGTSRLMPVNRSRRLDGRSIRTCEVGRRVLVPQTDTTRGGNVRAIGKR